LVTARHGYSALHQCLLAHARTPHNLIAFDIALAEQCRCASELAPIANQDTIFSGASGAIPFLEGHSIRANNLLVYK
jgi:hypothetical protein